MVAFFALLVVFTSAQLHAQSTAPAANAPAQPVKRVLFIGNSLTAAYNIPALVQALSVTNGTVRLDTDAVVMPGTNLEDQWNAGHARTAIRGAHWDFVVLQQGPTSRFEDRANLITYAKKFAREAKAAGATVALYMVWPPQSETHKFASIDAAFRGAAKETHGIFIPAGSAWRIFLERHQKADLYGADRFHPSAEGAVLSALVIHNVLCDCHLPRLPHEMVFPDGMKIQIEQPEALISAADQAITEAQAKKKK